MKVSRFVKDEFADDGSWSLNPISAQISALTRRNLYDELVLVGQNSQKRFAGRFDLTTFLKRIWPLKKCHLQILALKTRKTIFGST
jgi:hypothetical protein